MLDFELYDEFFAHPLDFRWHPHVEQLRARDNLTFAVFEEQPPAGNVYAATDFAAAYASTSVLHILQASNPQGPLLCASRRDYRECFTHAKLAYSVSSSSPPLSASHAHTCSAPELPRQCPGQQPATPVRSAPNHLPCVRSNPKTTCHGSVHHVLACRLPQ